MQDLEQRQKYLAEVLRLDPRVQIKGRSSHTSFVNDLRRVLGELESTLAHSTWAVEADLDESQSALTRFDPAKLTVADLRRAGFEREAVGALGPLDQAQRRLVFATAFYEGFGAQPTRFGEISARAASLAKSVEERLTKQIASERLTDSKPQASPLLAQAKALVKDPLRLVLSEPAKRHQGKWTEKDLLSETRHGNTIERKFRVKDTPYDYERVWFRVARPLPNRAGHCLVYDVWLQLNHLPYGDRPLGKWYLDLDQPAFVMLEKNLPEVE